MRKQPNKFEWMKRCEETAVLLLEGSDDCHIIKEFCQKNEIKPNFGFCKCGSDNQVLSRLNALLKKSEKPNILGVILDADKDVNARYQNIKSKAKDKNFYQNLPDSMPKTGLIHTERSLPKLGIWIMPNNQDNGALEEFYLELATNIDVDFIDKIIQQAEEKKGITSFKPQHRNKAMMHTYFAWQDSPSMPLHSAVRKTALDNNKDIAKAFKKWLTDLFN